MHSEKRGVADISIHVFPKGYFHALAADFSMIRFGYPGTPVIITVITQPVSNPRTSDGHGEEVRVRREELSLEGPGRMPDHANAFRIDQSHLNGFAHRRNDTLNG